MLNQIFCAILNESGGTVGPALDSEVTWQYLGSCRKIESCRSRRPTFQKTRNHVAVDLAISRLLESSVHQSPMAETTARPPSPRSRVLSRLSLPGLPRQVDCIAP